MGPKWSHDSDCLTEMWISVLYPKLYWITWWYQTMLKNSPKYYKTSLNNKNNIEIYWHNFQLFQNKNMNVCTAYTTCILFKNSKARCTLLLMVIPQHCHVYLLLCQHHALSQISCEWPCKNIMQNINPYNLTLKDKVKGLCTFL